MTLLGLCSSQAPLLKLHFSSSCRSCEREALLLGIASSTTTVCMCVLSQCFVRGSGEVNLGYR